MESEGRVMLLVQFLALQTQYTYIRSLAKTKVQFKTMTITMIWNQQEK